MTGNFQKYPSQIHFNHEQKTSRKQTNLSRTNNKQKREWTPTNETRKKNARARDTQKWSWNRNSQSVYVIEIFFAVKLKKERKVSFKQSAFARSLTRAFQSQVYVAFLSFQYDISACNKWMNKKYVATVDLCRCVCVRRNCFALN